jgi:hypothetical protein
VGDGGERGSGRRTRGPEPPAPPATAARRRLAPSLSRRPLGNRLGVRSTGRRRSAVFAGRASEPSPSRGWMRAWPRGWGEKRCWVQAPIRASVVNTGPNTPNPALPPSRGREREKEGSEWPRPETDPRGRPDPSGRARAQSKRPDPGRPGSGPKGDLKGPKVPRVSAEGRR